MRASSWYPPNAFGPRGQPLTSSGPVRATSLTLGTLRQTSTNVSADGASVAGSMSLMFDGSGNVISDETVLPQIAEILRALAVDAEVVGVDRPEQRVVGVGDSADAAIAEGGISPPRWRATAGSCSPACGNRRTNGRSPPGHRGPCRRTPGSREQQPRRARHRKRQSESRPVLQPMRLPPTRGSSPYWR